jgi:uncharacterized protein DUF6895
MAKNSVRCSRKSRAEPEHAPRIEAQALIVLIEESTLRWDRSDLIRRVIKALDFALLKMQAIGRGDAGGYASIASTPANRWHADQKAIAETAMLLWFVVPVCSADKEIAERLRAAAIRLVPLARNEDVLCAICADPGQADAYAVAHIILRRMGLPDTDFDEVLLASWGSPTAFRPEQTPFRRLEREWLARMLGGDAPRDARLVAESMLGRPLDIFTASTFDLYAFTHALMFASDFGLSRTRLPRRRSVIAVDADAALVASLDANDLDLSAELALTWPLLGKSWSTTAVFAFRILAAVEDREGFLPVLGMDLSRYRALPVGERSEHMLAHSYHSAYVMGFLCAAALRVRPALPAAVPERVRRAPLAGAAGAVLRLFDSNDAESCWEAHFFSLRERQQDALAPFALAALLRRAAARGNLALVRRALQVAVDFDMADGTVPIHAAALLRRSQLLDANRLHKLHETARTANAYFEVPFSGAAAQREAFAAIAGTVAATSKASVGMPA